MLTGLIQKQTQFYEVKALSKKQIHGPLVIFRGRIQKGGSFRSILQLYLAQRKFQNVVMDKES